MGSKKANNLPLRIRQAGSPLFALAFGCSNLGCDFCGKQYEFDPIDAAQLFTESGKQPPTSTNVQ